MIFFEDQHGLCCFPRSEITSIEQAFPDRLRVETRDGTVGYCYEAIELAQAGDCPCAANRSFATDQIRRVQSQKGSLLLTLANGETIKVTPKWVPGVRKFLGLDRYRPQPESLTRVFLREYPFEIVRARVEVLQLHFRDPRTLIANLIWQAREQFLPRIQVRRGKSHRGFWYNPIRATLERAGFINKDFSKESAEALYLRQISQMVYHDRLFDYRDLGFDDEFAHHREIGARRPDIILVIEKDCVSDAGIEAARRLGISWIITGGISRHVSVEFFCHALHRVYKGPVIVIDFGDFDPGGWVAGHSFVNHLARYDTPCPAGPHYLTRPELYTEEEIELFSRPLDSDDDRIDDWLLKSGGIDGKSRGIHCDWLQPPERVFKALEDILQTVAPLDLRDAKGFFVTRAPSDDQIDETLDEALARKQEEASQYIAAVQDPVEREVVSLAYNLMISSLFRRSGQGSIFFEPLEFFDILKRMLKHKELLQGLLSGKYLTLEEGCEDLGIF